MAQLSTSINDFTVNFFKTFASTNSGNALFSPWSILNGFAMVLAGARGTSRDEILSSLCLKQLAAAAGDDEKALAVHEMISMTDKILEFASSNDTFFKGANKLWMANSYKALDTFLSDLRSYYNVDVGSADFVGDSEGARHEINSWVENKTKEKIKNLFPEGSIDGLTRLVLANAIYFKGLWEKPFDKEATSKSEFFITETESVGVDMMFVAGKFPMCFDKELKLTIIELPYKGGRFSMQLLIPQERMGYKKVEKQLTATKFSSWKLTPSRMSTDIFLPKFSLSVEVGLKDLLQSLGVKEVFSESAADLSGITGTRDLYVSSAFHKACVEVDEEGTVAAAATGIGIALMCMPMQILADHPFFFMIKEKSKDAILFFGKVMNPLE